MLVFFLWYCLDHRCYDYFCFSSLTWPNLSMLFKREKQKKHHENSNPRFEKIVLKVNLVWNCRVRYCSRTSAYKHHWNEQNIPNIIGISKSKYLNLRVNKIWNNIIFRAFIIKCTALKKRISVQNITRQASMQ